MLAVILAAGIGSRLLPLTETKPKSLVRVYETTPLLSQIKAYKAAGFKTLVIITGHKKEEIALVTKHIKGIKIILVENNLFDTTNNMYSLLLAKPYIDNQDFFWSNADVVIAPKIIKLLAESPHANAIAVDAHAYYEESMKVEVDTKNVITHIAKTIPEEKSFGTSIDIYKCSAQAATLLFKTIEEEYINKGLLSHWVEVALDTLIKNRVVNFFPCDISGNSWVEIDNWQDLAIADIKFSQLTAQLPKLKNYFFDIDGTLCLQHHPISQEGINHINEMIQQDKNVFFISNNSSRSKADYLKLLNNLNINNITLENIILSQDALIDFLKEQETRSVYVLGTNSLTKEIAANNIQVNSNDVPEYVVIGFDTEMTYEKLRTAVSYINKNVDYIVTHCDIACPTLDSGPIPDAGAFIYMIELVTGRAPAKVFGKPNAQYLEYLFDKLNLATEESVIIGDRLYTDIQLADNLGCHSILVLSGETTRATLDQLSLDDYYPDLIIDNIGALDDLAA